MEPVTTIEGFNTRNNPREARKLLTSYYERLGYHVVKLDKSSTPEKGAARDTHNEKGKVR
jgi:uncharacterized protein YueI